jgi:hypothetical protein
LETVMGIVNALDLHFPYISAGHAGYMDFFRASYGNKEPIILEEGTSVRFPAGWTDEDADKWPKAMELQRSSNYTARTYSNWYRRGYMRSFEITVALIVALMVFVAVKLLGFVIHIAIAAAVMGVVLGFVIARAFRSNWFQAQGAFCVAKMSAGHAVNGFLNVLRW